MTAAIIPGPQHVPSVGASHRQPLSSEVYRRRRLAVAALVFGLVLGLLSLGRHADASRSVDQGSADTLTYIVQPGDTLWHISARLAPDADRRAIVSQLDDLAGGASLQPGQHLVIPVDVLR